MRLNEKLNLEENRIFFCSDLHYNHRNVLNLSQRPFKDVGEMNQYLIETLKSTLKSGDIVFDLGDTFWQVKQDEVEKFFKACPENVTWYKVMGNHDKSTLYYGDNNAFIGKHYKIISDRLHFNLEYKNETCLLILSHFPELDWHGRFRGSLMLHGHCHGHLDELNKKSGELRVDIGFDGELAKSYGSFLIPFEYIYDYLKGFTKECRYFNEYFNKYLN